MEIIFTIIICMFYVTLIIFMIKNLVTYKQHTLINEAILKYHLWCIHHNFKEVVDYEDMEDYDKTLFRLYDWGYKNILPPEKFEIIKPFIE